MNGNVGRRAWCNTGVKGCERNARRTEARFGGGAVAHSASILSIALILGLFSAVPASAAGVEADAKEILRSMSDYLGGQAAFSMDVDIDNEVLDQQGQKLHLSSSASLVIERPDKFYAHRRSGAGEVELIFDGKVMTIHGMSRNVYLTIDSPGDIDQALQNARIETGFDFPGADLIYSDPYDGLMTGVESGTYLGSGYVNGVECHHLAFRTPQVDWQIWVQTGDKPWPMKYVITTKWVTAAPQYVARFSNWNAAPKIKSSRFEFSPKAGAKKLDQLPVGPTGDLEGN